MQGIRGQQTDEISRLPSPCACCLVSVDRSVHVTESLTNNALNCSASNTRWVQRLPNRRSAQPLSGNMDVDSVRRKKQHQLSRRVDSFFNHLDANVITTHSGGPQLAVGKLPRRFRVCKTLCLTCCALGNNLDVTTRRVPGCQATRLWRAEKHWSVGLAETFATNHRAHARRDGTEDAL